MSDPKATVPGRVGSAQNRDQGWRKRLDGLDGLVEELCGILDDQGDVVHGPDGTKHKASDIVRRLRHLIDSANGSNSAETRAAWDAYASSAGAVQTFGPWMHGEDIATSAAAYADRLLEERRKRFTRREP